MRGLRCLSEIGHREHPHVAHKQRFIHHLSVSLVPNLEKTMQSPKSDLTPWILTLVYLLKTSYHWVKALNQARITHRYAQLERKALEKKRPQGPE